MPDHPAEAPDLAAIRASLPSIRAEAKKLKGAARAWSPRAQLADRVLQLCDALDAQAERLAQWEQLAAEKNWHYVHDQRYDEMVLEKIRAENERDQARGEAAALRPYVEHRPLCVRLPMGSLKTTGCTCGLMAALAPSEPAS